MLVMRDELIAVSLALTLGCLASAAWAAQCPDTLQQDKSQQNSADEAHVRGDLAAGSDCGEAGDKARSEKKNEEAAERVRSNIDQRSGTTGQGKPKD